MHIAVTADRPASEHGAFIIVDHVAIIACFPLMNDAVTAARLATIHAVIDAAINAGRARVASLPGLYDAVTASRQGAVVGAKIGVHGVAVIAGFVGLDKTVAADGAATQRRARCRGAIRGS